MIELQEPSPSKTTLFVIQKRPPFFFLFLSVPLVCVSVRAPFHIQWRQRYIPTSSGHQVFSQQPLIILFHQSLIFEKKIHLFSETGTISVSRISLMNREDFQDASPVSLVTRQFFLFCMTGVGALLS